jgi:hypothetical protein
MQFYSFRNIRETALIRTGRETPSCKAFAWQPARIKAIAEKNKSNMVLIM